MFLLPQRHLIAVTLTTLLVIAAVIAPSAAAAAMKKDDDETTAAAAYGLDNVDLWQGGLLSPVALPSSGDVDSLVVSLEDTAFETYWDNLPSLGTKNKLNVQGYSFQGRMAVYKYLISEMDSAALWEKPTSTTTTTNTTSSSLIRKYHWLWAFGSQLDWQHRSGRLAWGSDDGKLNNKDDKISLNSWWGYMNFGFSVAILVGLEQSGIEKDLVLQLDSVSKKLVETDTHMQKVIAAWSDFFQNGYSNYAKALSSSTSGKKDAATWEVERFRLQQNLWVAHIAVIDNLIDSPQSQELLAQLPVVERDFGRGWARMVEILAACVFPTDLVTLMYDGAGYLPTVVMTDDEWTRQLERFEASSSKTNNADTSTGAPMSPAEKRRVTTVKSTHKLVGMPESSFKNSVAFWKRVVRNYRTSRSMPSTIVKLFHGSPLVKAGQLARVLWLFVRPKEWLAIAVGVVGFAAVWQTR